MFGHPNISSSRRPFSRFVFLGEKGLKAKVLGEL